MELGLNMMAAQPISTEYFINPSHHFVCLYVYTSFVARQRLGKVTAATNIHAAVEKLLVKLFSTRILSYTRGVCGGGIEYLHSPCES
jgi:hypothetical protein